MVGKVGKYLSLGPKTMGSHLTQWLTYAVMPVFMKNLMLKPFKVPFFY